MAVPAGRAGPALSARCRLGNVGSHRHGVGPRCAAKGRFNTRPEAKLIPHTDRDCRYGSDDYLAVLKQLEARPSMSRKGDRWDNAVAESFFATIKNELLNRQPWPTKTHAHQAIFSYIEGWYNTRRRHSSLGYLSPATYETTTQPATAPAIA